MSDFIDALVDMLPEHNSLKKSNNELRRLLDISVGEWFDNRDITEFYSNLFLNSATGAYLDLFGVDYGVTRQVDESDDNYRNRIIQEKNDHLTPEYLQSLYGLTLYHYVPGFNVSNNTLTSDNQYMTGYYMGIASDEIKKMLNEKFIMDNIILWINDDGTVDYILNTSDESIFEQYFYIYEVTNASSFLGNNTSVGKVNLHLPNVIIAQGMFSGCTGLTDLKLDIPNAIANPYFCGNCSGLVNIDVNMPNATSQINPVYIFPTSSSVLKTVNLNVVSNMKSYWVDRFSDSSDYPNLEYLCVNGEEVDLS